MGLFDLASPLFDWIRASLLSGLPDAAQIALFAIVSAIATMSLYVVFSRQDAIEVAKTEAKSARAELAVYDGDPDGLAPLAFKSIKASFKHLGLTLWPAFLASVPILFVLGWLNTTYSYAPLQGGETLRLMAYPAEAAITAPGLAPVEGEPGAYTITWPADGATLTDAAGTQIAKLPGALDFAVLDREGWFNLLFGNPLGHIPADSPVEAVVFELTAIDHLGIGPGWLGSWEMIYFTLLIAGSLTIKFVFKVN